MPMRFPRVCSDRAVMCNGSQTGDEDESSISSRIDDEDEDYEEEDNEEESGEDIDDKFKACKVSDNGKKTLKQRGRHGRERRQQHQGQQGQQQQHGVASLRLNTSSQISEMCKESSRTGPTLILMASVLKSKEFRLHKSEQHQIVQRRVDRFLEMKTYDEKTIEGIANQRLGSLVQFAKKGKLALRELFKGLSWYDDGMPRRYLYPDILPKSLLTQFLKLQHLIVVSLKAWDHLGLQLQALCEKHDKEEKMRSILVPYHDFDIDEGMAAEAIGHYNELCSGVSSFLGSSLFHWKIGFKESERRVFHDKNTPVAEQLMRLLLVARGPIPAFDLDLYEFRKETPESCK